jgi:hypothetical protein
MSAQGEVEEVNQDQLKDLDKAERPLSDASISIFTRPTATSDKPQFVFPHHNKVTTYEMHEGVIMDNFDPEKVSFNVCNQYLHRLISPYETHISKLDLKYAHWKHKARFFE